MSLHVTSVDLSMKHCVSAYMAMFVFVTSNASLLLAFEASLEATLRAVGGVAPIDDEKVTILVDQTPVCGSTSMMIRLVN